MNHSGQLFVITAPSGTGKTTLVKRLRQSIDQLGVSISHTTRLPRTGETNGVDYHFVEDAEFDRMIKHGEFLEHAGNYGNRYGTSHHAANCIIATGQDLLLEIDWQGAQQIKTLTQSAIWILIAPPSLQILKQRLIDRDTESADSIEARLTAAQIELDQAKAADYLIINDQLDQAANALEAVVRAQRFRFARSTANSPSSLFSKDLIQ